MSKDMLGSVIRAAVGVPQDRMDVLAKIASAMAADNPAGEAWHARFKEQLKEGLLSSKFAADAIIRVDRSVRPSYPDWVKMVMHPKLEPTGPAEYDITKVKQWLHDGQKNGKWVKGEKLYAHLKETDSLKTCLGLSDLEEIQKKGIAFFRKHFQHSKAVFAWKSVVRNSDGSLLVPYLCEDGDEVVVDWNWLDNDWYDSNPALRFAS